MSELPPLAALRALEAVVRTGSVNGAAALLGRTHGAISKHLRALQDHAGVTLLTKKGTGVAPTPAAIELAQAVRRALDELGAAYDRIVGETRSPMLRIACSATFAMRWLVPHLKDFSRQRPEIRIRLAMISARDMRYEQDADFAILWDRSAYPPADQARAIRVGGTRFVAVAAPDYPVIRQSECELGAPCRLTHEFTTTAWELWSRYGGVTLQAQRTASFPHSHLCIEAALAGIGVALAEERLVSAELASGRLAALTPPVTFPDGIAVVPHRMRPLRAEALSFVAWLETTLIHSPISVGS